MNKIYAHPGQPQMQVEVILASRHADMMEEKPLYTVRMRYPRPIHGEIMTHRVFGRNARSSRAVPVKTMLNEVRSIPYVPWHWGKNQKGMQAAEECDEPVYCQKVLMPLNGYAYGHSDDWKDTIIETTGITREDAWLVAASRAADMAEAFMEAGYHKQNPNRLLEPFSWIDTLITANRWDNFLWLRDHKDAEPHLQDLAQLVMVAMEEAEIQKLASGEWHLPYITDEDFEAAYDEYFLTSATKEWDRFLCKISAARCARISYKPFDGDASYEKELARYDQLVNSDRVHASPLEHQANPDRIDPDYPNCNQWENPSLHGNLPGWIQARKLVSNEVHNG